MLNRLVRWLRYQAIRQSRQALYAIFYPKYAKAQLRHQVPLGILVANTIFQRLLRVNGKCAWPVHYTSRVTFPERISLGDEARLCCAVNGSMYIQGINGISVGQRTLLASGTKLISANHLEARLGQHVVDRPLEIGDDCWLGSNVVILPGVTIGDAVIVGAGAVVTKDVADGQTVAGVPARPVSGSSARPEHGSGQPS